jgi:membrane protein
MNVIIKRLLEFYKEFSRKEVGILPSYLAFYILLSFIPLLTLTLVSLSLINRDNDTLLMVLQDVFPSNVYRFISQFVDNTHVKVQVFTINNLVLLYLASRIYYSIYHSNTIIVKTKCCRNFIYDKLIALLNTAIILVTVIVLTVVLIMGNYFNHFLMDYFHFVHSFTELMRILVTLFAVSLFTIVIMLSLPHYQFKIKRVWKGALVSSILIMLMSYIFKEYVEHYSNYQSTYYAFSTILVLILWIYLISYSIIIGLVVNYHFEKINNHNTK